MKSTIRILAAGGIGDVLLLTPVLRQIKRSRPNCKLVVYCLNPQRYEILVRNPNIDILKVVSLLDRLLYLTRMIEGKFTDYGKLMPNTFYSHNASHIIGEMLGVGLSETDIEIFLSPEEEERGRQSVAGLKYPVAMGITGACSPNKNWPLERWNALVRSMPEVSFIQLGLPGESLVDGAIDMRGLPLRESFARLKFARAFIGVDSGLAHAAAGLRVPAIVLFGPSNPEMAGHARSNNLYHKVHCSPCLDILFDAPCPYDRRCMSAIGTAEVAKALQKTLGMDTASSPGPRTEDADIRVSLDVKHR